MPSAARRAGYGCLRYRPGDGSEGAPGYTAVSAGGEWPGTAEAPPGFRIPGAAGGLVLGVHRHDTDAESVVVHELAGGEGQPAAGGSIAQMAGADLTGATSATRAIAETDASAPDREPAGWRVETGVGGGNPVDTMRNAYSPPAGPPGALAGAGGGFRSTIRYLCLNTPVRGKRGTSPPPVLRSGNSPARPGRQFRGH